jgi:16S rRNA (guanine1207-N2)-methyltransferase
VTISDRIGVYGRPPSELVEVDGAALQFSPLVPGSDALEQQGSGTLVGVSIVAPPGTVERRYTLALALRAVAPGAPFCVLALKDKGGSRIGKELAGFGCSFNEVSKRHYRICTGRRPDSLSGLEEAILAGAPRLDGTLGLWTQPGVFSWDRIDPGSALLLQIVPPLAGQGADLGCGIGYLAHGILASPRVEHLTLVDVDRRAAEALRNGGTCWLVANRHLPYEAVMKPLFRRISLRGESGGYKIYEAQK